MTAPTYFKNKEVKHEGYVWHIDAKMWPPTSNRAGTLRVYRVHGDVSKPDILKEALQTEADALGLSLALALKR